MTINLDEIKTRCDAATPGPWEVSDSDYVFTLDGGHGTPWDLFQACGNADEDGANCKFIALAREDVPALVAEIEKLQCVVNEVFDMVDKGDDAYTTWNVYYRIVEYRKSEGGDK